MNQIVETFTTEFTPVQRYLPEMYQLRRDRPLVWFQRFMFWILRKLKCYAIVTDQMVSRHRIDTQEFVERIYKQNAELLRLYHQRGERLLIGAEDFKEMMGGPEFSRAFSFWGSYMADQTVMGMKVTIIPWMRGVLVVPREVLEPTGVKHGD